MGVTCEIDLAEISNTGTSLWYKYCALTDNRLRRVNIPDQINPVVSKCLVAPNRVACRGSDYASFLVLNLIVELILHTFKFILLQFCPNLVHKDFFHAGVCSFHWIVSQFLCALIAFLIAHITVEALTPTRCKTTKIHSQAEVNQWKHSSFFLNE